MRWLRSGRRGHVEGCVTCLRLIRKTLVGFPRFLSPTAVRNIAGPMESSERERRSAADLRPKVSSIMSSSLLPFRVY